MDISLPIVYEPIFLPSRFKVIDGGRGSAKSETVARYFLIKARQQLRRIICTREYQSNIQESVHKTLKDIINQYELDDYDVLKYTITNKRTGSEFIFEGMQNMNGLKSIKGVTDVWSEESQTVTQDNLDILIPSIRLEGSELVFTMNIETENDPVIKTLVGRPETWRLHTTYRDNPFFPDVLRREMEYCKANNPEKYDHIWEGNAKKTSEACIFKSKYEVRAFETPTLDKITYGRFFYGADWGFSQDPTVLLRSFVIAPDLYIDYEACGVGVELDDTPALFDSVPESRQNKIYADNSRPETISHIRNRGFMIESAPKWQGSVEDGITYLKNFRRIYIHPRCKNMIDEAKFYSYKIDRITGEVLPIIVDANNHGWDALRYGHSKYIKCQNNVATGIVNMEKSPLIR